MTTESTGRRRVPQSPRRRYHYPIERRAALAVGMIKRSGWTAKLASGVFCVNRTYLWYACRLNDADRLRLACGEITLAELHRQWLAERRAAKRNNPSDDKIDHIVRRYGADRVMAALDRATAPQRVAAE